MTNSNESMTVPKFVALKRAGQKISVLTAYDFTMAQLVDAAGVDAILVGDSLAMVVQGHHSTIPVTLDEMIYHGEMVCRGVKRALVIVDLPFPTFHLGKHRAVEAAARILKETGCQAVKLEGGVDQAETIAALAGAGIPVMAHVGLRPQSVLQLGGYRVQRDEERLRADALAAEQAGAFGIVLECIPTGVAARITQEIKIPTIGIGAGPDCDGQVLVTPDLLGLTGGHVPKFVRAYADLRGIISQAVAGYREDVRAGKFPASSESFQ